MIALAFTFFYDIFINIQAYNFLVIIMRKILILIFAISFFCVKVNATGFKLDNVGSYILIEETTGKIICEENSKKRQAPASMTKIMTMTLILEEIKKGNLSYDDMITTSGNASSQEGSRIFLSTNEKMSVGDMLKGIAIASANDASVALAEKISGSVEGFVAKMNEYAKNLGLENTLFQNPTGLTAENHYSCSYDMAMMAKNLINKFPEILDTTKIYQDYLRKDTSDPFWLVNTNKLVYSGEVDGLKTGWTEEAGYCLTATRKEAKMRLIGVIMGANDAKERNSKMLELLNHGFANYKIENVATKGKIIASVYDVNCKPAKFDVVLKEDVNILVSKNYQPDKLDYKYNFDYKQLPVGSYDIYIDGVLVSKNELVLSNEIKKSNIIDKMISIFDIMLKI